MPEIVCKITQDDGTEQSFGPVTVPNTVVEDVAQSLTSYEEERQATLAADRVASIEAEQAARSVEAERLNTEREQRGQDGLDPDDVNAVATSEDSP